MIDDKSSNQTQGGSGRVICAPKMTVVVLHLREQQEILEVARDRKAFVQSAARSVSQLVVRGNKNS